jgi:hypothetical protein
VLIIELGEPPSFGPRKHDPDSINRCSLLAPSVRLFRETRNGILTVSATTSVSFERVAIPVGKMVAEGG